MHDREDIPYQMSPALILKEQDKNDSQVDEQDYEILESISARLKSRIEYYRSLDPIDLSESNLKVKQQITVHNEVAIALEQELFAIDLIIKDNKKG